LLSKKDFEEKTTDRTGLPEPGGKISGIAGLQALSNLFYDTIKFKSNNLIRSSKSVSDYIDFMQKMTAVFIGDQEKVKGLEDLKGKTVAEKEAAVSSSDFPKLDEITDSQMASMCNNLQDYVKEPIHPKSAEGRAILKQAALLFGRQIRHAANCGRILRQLFTTVSINGVVSIRINKMVFIKGILELNRINDQARRVLIDYYTDCEALYKTGVEILNNAKQGQDIQRKAALDEPNTYNATRKASATRGGGITRRKDRSINV
jgi:predicted ATPase